MLRPQLSGGTGGGSEPASPPSWRRLPKPNGKLRRKHRDEDLVPQTKEEAPVGGWAPERRFVNTWFEGEAPVLPLVVGRRYPFKLQIGPRRAEASGSPAPFVEPDWGARQDVHLLITLYSQDFAIEGRHHSFPMPRRGASAVLMSHLKPLHVGRCQLQLIVSLAFELEVLQELEVEVEAAEVPAAVPVIA